MKVYQLLAELENKNPDATVYLMDEDGEKVKLNRVYNIDDRKTPFEKQDILLMERF